MTGPELSRRGFVAGAAGAGLALCGAPAFGAPARVGAGAPQTADIIVIGAGLAGLTAARALSAQGAAVIVLEARDRPGGRVWSQRLPGGPMIDLGAQFIGDAQTHITALAEEAGLRRISAVVGGDVLHLARPDAEPRRQPPDALPLSMIDQLDALQALWRLERSMNSLGRQDRARLDRIDATSYLRARTFLDPAFEALAGYVEGELCTPLDRVSAYEVLEQGASVSGFSGEGASAQWFLAEGAQGLTDFLAGSVADSLILNAPVSRVEQGAAGVSITASTGLYHAARAIVAVPPQLYGAIGLLPGLPSEWRAALSGWQLGTVIKTMLVFEQPWWRQRGLSGTILSPGSRFGACLDASPEGGPGILVVFSTASGAAALGRLPEEAERIAAALRWLAHVCGGDLPDLVGARSVDWSTEQFSLGGYASRRGIGGWSTAPDLFAPHGRLHFAGTETADRWRSFMDGAVQSGLRAAREVSEQALTGP